MIIQHQPLSTKPKAQRCVVPWKVSGLVNERLKITADVLKRERSITELCEIYGIARKTGYKRVERFQVSGPPSIHQ